MYYKLVRQTKVKADGTRYEVMYLFNGNEQFCYGWFVQKTKDGKEFYKPMKILKKDGE